MNNQVWGTIAVITFIVMIVGVILFTIGNIGGSDLIGVLGAIMIFPCPLWLLSSFFLAILNTIWNWGWFV